MFQIDGPDTVSAKPTKKPPETIPGYFDGGDPIAGTKATMVTRDWLNTVQDEIKNVIEGAEMQLDRTKDDQLFAAIKALINVTVEEATHGVGGVPTGAIFAFYGTKAPEGYLACDGSSFDVNLYPALYAVLGKALTPDLRGCFIRGVGGLSGVLGASQEDAGRNLTGSAHFSRAGQNWGTNENGCLKLEVNGSGALGLINGGAAGYINATLSLNATGAYGASHVANEFRPKNMALLYCVKHD
ncbi:MAG: phage tail protein [Deltaproteobacteria bacterium]|jgi:microcystin-dependent protein|nr:phage tail protein [Deltaproteobacteria bacterium]